MLVFIEAQGFSGLGSGSESKILSDLSKPISEFVRVFRRASCIYCSGRALVLVE